ncbi:centrosomal protein of 72 kDa-like isoform X2 [Tubulanus polymorphus]|uniref:centrosomal protein of 72 kDa-like isoform X2 n=1 Tax=Tubulanus polymorphus TaxID=672921 RepID=UPI003DA33BA7
MSKDVRSLTLPGTYHEKISLLGNAFKKFTRLKQLDLSRNCLESLDGIDHLQLLEKLNLYYNNIDTLDELYKLRSNQNLTELDLRLNPVTRNEPDYRLFLIHMLPNLKMLDDRSVRDGERKAALIHYSTDQAVEFKDAKMEQNQTPSKQNNPRVDMINNMKKTSALDDDDVELLDLIARTGGINMSKPREITGSKADIPEIKVYSTDQILQLEKNQDNIRYTPPMKDGEKPEKLVEEGKNRKRTTLGTQPAENAEEKYPHITSKTTLGDIQLQNWAELAKVKNRDDPNLKFQDEADAYNRVNVKAEGNFTPHPGAPISSMPPTFPANTVPYHPAAFPHYPEQFASLPPTGMPPYYQYPNIGPPPMIPPYNTEVSTGPAPVDHKAHGEPLSEYSSFLYQICDLVDKYWNGSKSLHKHPKFNVMADRVIKEFLAQAAHPSNDKLKHLQTRVSQLSNDNSTLKEHSRSTADDSRELSDSLDQAKKDVEWLRHQLQKTIEENKNLQKKINELELSASTTTATQITNSSVATDEIQRQNQGLQQEIEVLKIRLKQYSKMQELANMLQESHKSLVETNDHLLREIDDSKKRHHADVQQLHWSYNQLKKTMTSQMNSSVENSLINGH